MDTLMRHWPHTWREKKAEKEKIVMLTAYDFPTAMVLDKSGVDAVLVGDSLANVFQGQATTLGVTMDHMIYHTQAVSRACKHALVVGDMPYLSYQISLEEAKRHAGRFLQEGGAQAVKLECGPDEIETVRALVHMGIPVMGHLGFTPQSVNQLGGFRVQGKTPERVRYVLELAQQLEAAGCFAIVLEMMPADAAKTISQALAIPTIGIGAGPDCDGQVLVTQDLLGLTEGPSKKFVKQYADLGQIMASAIENFKQEVEQGLFPTESQSF